jgi:outer membrane protein assembly factor BamB
MNRLRALFALLLCASSAWAADWPQWLGPRRDGGTPEKVAPWKKAPAVVWKQPAGPGFSVPVVANGRVFVHARIKGKNEEEVVAFDAKTGKQLWRDVYARAPYKSMMGAGPRATPAVAAGRLYTFGITGVLSCYQTDSGKRLWQVDAYKQLKAGLPPFGACCSPLVVGNRVLVSVGGKGTCLAAFDTDKGELLWSAFDEPASTASAVLFAGGGRRPGALPDVVFMTTLRLLAVSPLDGRLQWELPLVFQPAGASPTPVVAGDRLVTSTISNGTVAVKVARKDGKPVPARDWQNAELRTYFSTGVTVGPDHLYLVTNVTDPLPAATLRCVALATGKEVWKKEDVGSFHAGLLRTGDNRLLVLDDTGTLTLLEAGPKGGRELARAKVCDGTFVAPALANGLLYVRDPKQVTCLRLND